MSTINAHNLLFSSCILYKYTCLAFVCSNKECHIHRHKNNVPQKVVTPGFFRDKIVSFGIVVIFISCISMLDILLPEYRTFPRRIQDDRCYMLIRWKIILLEHHIHNYLSHMLKVALTLKIYIFEDVKKIVAHRWSIWVEEDCAHFGNNLCNYNLRFLGSRQKRFFHCSIYPIRIYQMR